MGGVAAALTHAAREHCKPFLLGQGDGHSWATVAVAELISTFVHCFAVLNVATTNVLNSLLLHLFAVRVAPSVTLRGTSLWLAQQCLASAWGVFEGLGISRCGVLTPRPATPVGSCRRGRR